MPTRSSKGKARQNPMVPIRVDRFRGAQRLDGRSWPDIARKLGTTHPRLFHLTHGEGGAQRRCRQSLRDRFARLLGVDRDWLSGETDALQYVVTADASVVNLDPSVSGNEVPRWSVWQGSPPPIPEFQLALDRLMAGADSALRRDLAKLPADYTGTSSREQLRRFAVLLIAHSVEMGIDFVEPLPPLEKADALRLSALKHAATVLQPWIGDSGAYPKWRRLTAQLVDVMPDEESRTGVEFMYADMSDELVTIYDRLRRVA